LAIAVIEAHPDWPHGTPWRPDRVTDAFGCGKFVCCGPPRRP
jgi:hypothetical protein